MLDFHSFNEKTSVFFDDGWHYHFSQHVENGQSVVSVIQFVLDIVLLRLVLFGRETRGVLHRGLAIDIKKYLKANEELWKLKYFTMQNI